MMENTEIKFYYIIAEINGQRLFVNQEGDYSDNFDNVMRFYSRIDGAAYIVGHINNVKTDIIGIAK